MDDWVRDTLHAGAGRLDGERVDVDALIERDHARRSRTRAVTTALALVLAALALPQLLSTADTPTSVRVDPDPVAPPASVASPADDAAPTSPPDAPGPGLHLRFIFTGEEGRAGCSYDGPERLMAGSYTFELVDHSDGSSIGVNVDKLRDGLTYADYLRISGAGDVASPVRIPDENYGDRPDPERPDPPPGGTIYEAGEPRDEGWNAGPNRTVASSLSRAGEITLVPGEFVVRCFSQIDTQTTSLWPDGGPLTVVPAP